MSDSVQPHGLQPFRLLCPWDFPGQSTGVGCQCLLRSLPPTASKYLVDTPKYSYFPKDLGFGNTALERFFLHCHFPSQGDELRAGHLLQWEKERCARRNKIINLHGIIPPSPPPELNIYIPAKQIYSICRHHSSPSPKAPFKHTHVCACARMHAHTRARAHTHTHTHTP